MTSIDGIGEHFNYLRWPLRWDQVEKNLVKYRDMLQNKNFQMNSSFTGSPFNLYYIDTYEQWSREFFKGTSVDGNWFFKNPHPVVGPINLESVPEQLKEIIREKYTADSRIYKIIDRYDPEKY